MRRKAQGLPMNVIIVAAIALVVLVVISFIFITKSKGFTSTADSCESKQGECCTSEKCEGPSMGQLNCPDGQICCLGGQCAT